MDGAAPKFRCGNSAWEHEIVLIYNGRGLHGLGDCSGKKRKMNIPPWTRTKNPLLRRQMPYPLGQRDFADNNVTTGFASNIIALRTGRVTNVCISRRTMTDPETPRGRRTCATAQPPAYAHSAPRASRAHVERIAAVARAPSLADSDGVEGWQLWGAPLRSTRPTSAPPSATARPAVTAADGEALPMSAARVLSLIHI